MILPQSVVWNPNQSRGTQVQDDNLVDRLLHSHSHRLDSFTFTVYVHMWVRICYPFFVVVFRCATLRQRRLSVLGLGVISILTACFDRQ